MYGMNGAEGDTGENKNIWDMYPGVDQPEYQEPDTARYDDLVSRYQPQYDPEAINKQLQNDFASITARYDVEREEAQRSTESERQSQISGLYDVGVVNPLSSGLASIGTASKAVLDRRMDNISSREQSEKSAAEDRAYGRKTEGRQEALGFAMDERDRIEQESAEGYERERQAMLDSVDMVNNIVSAWKSGRTVARQDKEDAKQGLTDLVEMGGYQVFEGMTADDISDLESASGYPAGTINSWAEKLKNAEADAEASKKNEYEMRTIDGSLYLIYPNQIDENGLPKKELFIKKPKSTGTGGAKKKAMSGDFKKWYYESFGEYAIDESDPTVVAEWERWQATGGSAGGGTEEGEWIAVGKDKVLVDKKGNELKRMSPSSSDTDDSSEMSDEDFIKLLQGN